MLFPGTPHVAVFDTAFHRTLPEVARTYALPRALPRPGIRRFGFHGLSVQWAAERVQVERLVVCHLGGGSSVTAVRDGRSIDTTMGFTPARRRPDGDPRRLVDPGRPALPPPARRLESTSSTRHSSTSRACWRSPAPPTSRSSRRWLSRSAAGARHLLLPHRPGGRGMATALGGLDALVFTAGVGEHAARVRAARLRAACLSRRRARRSGEQGCARPGRDLRGDLSRRRPCRACARGCRRRAGRPQPHLSALRVFHSGRPRSSPTPQARPAPRLSGR